MYCCCCAKRIEIERGDRWWTYKGIPGAKEICKDCRDRRMSVTCRTGHHHLCASEKCECRCGYHPFLEVD